ncbi:MAG: three-Cys-motif partner protein TcmP [Phenylobacterium sp.]|uniref:three-Cys-motif partner protein TcmP n=1 Tax=Phenylobacterium sp. TaxID=1871053 RepID=UPI002736451A|nr:three-Cys-motif partner protein TcmP [Phenylobacterium sp.]MDP1642844.1 three-Cys-motif partner protein TcmP [Phenylobacterium sp.]MDP3116385.1 three-Cys-motif partner protein TcmP [Phenylobacterium sp.]MDP3381731.1 three-Cys-motif partner protein TcmP [Phenylobacterium sp.]
MASIGDHEFGSGLTDLKLSIIAEYLQRYNTALSRQPFFERWYFDAFAGTGERTVRLSGSAEDLLNERVEERIERRRGSARIALDTIPQFHRCIFMEQKKRHALALEALCSEPSYASRKTFVLRGDANRAIQDHIQTVNWKKARAVMFLDPYGMNVEWQTLEAIRRTEAIDLWYLVSLSGLYRQATHRGSALDEKKRAALSRMLGTPAWEKAWYEEDRQRDLLSMLDSEETRRTASLDLMEDFVLQRLRSLFPTVLEPLRLKNDRNAPMFSLFFAMSNPSPAAARVAIPIAQHILTQARRRR